MFLTIFPTLSGSRPAKGPRYSVYVEYCDMKGFENSTGLEVRMFEEGVRGLDTYIYCNILLGMES